MRGMQVGHRMAAMLLAVLLAACGQAGQKAQNAAATTPPPVTNGGTSAAAPATAARIAISATKYSIRTDGVDRTTIRVIVTDASNVGVQGARVSFATTGGQLTAKTATTDAYGQASVDLLSTILDKSNQVASVTATLQSNPAITATIPIQITGTTLALKQGTGALTVGGVADTLYATVTDAAGQPIPNIAVTFSATGGVKLGTTKATTDVHGKVSTTVSATGAGTATITASGAGATAAVTYTVKTPANAFAILSPATSPYDWIVGSPLTITVQASGVTNVDFYTSFGSWGSATGPASTSVAVAGGKASAALYFSRAGVAVVRVQDAANPNTSASITIRAAQPAANAAHVTLQASSAVIAPSAGNQQSTTTLTAKVTDASGQPVKGATVVFSIPAPSGGGEYVTPPVATTDALGIAKATFVAGTQSTSSKGVNVYATVAGVATPGVANIVVGGQAASLFIGIGTVLPDLNPATYRLPMSVLVTDTNGNAVSGAQVTLSTWPVEFAVGPACGPAYPVDPNEDVNRNNILDPGEDRSHVAVYYVSSKTGKFVPANDPYAVAHAYTIFADGVLTPPMASAGSVPASVTTDQNGVATFDLVYPKTSALWVKTEITARTRVFGTEATSRVTFWLFPSVPDVGPPCHLSPSPFNGSPAPF